MKLPLLLLTSLFTIIPQTLAATKAEQCPESNCPKEYQLAAPVKGTHCPECAAPNCGGFAGQECLAGFECFYPQGSSGGYCVKKQTIVGENTQDCLVCAQVMPDCNAAECAEGSRCMVVPQSCHQCARTECLPSLTGQAQCVACDKKMPLCSCQPGQDCVIHPMTCEKCSWAECK